MEQSARKSRPLDLKRAQNALPFDRMNRSASGCVSEPKANGADLTSTKVMR